MTRQLNHVPQDTVGLRNVARKLQARKRKAATDNSSQKAATGSPVKEKSPGGANVSMTETPAKDNVSGQCDCVEGSTPNRNIEEIKMDVSESVRVSDSKVESNQKDIDAGCESHDSKTENSGGESNTDNNSEISGKFMDDGKSISQDKTKCINDLQSSCEDNMEVDIEHVSPVKKNTPQTSSSKGSNIKSTTSSSVGRVGLREGEDIAFAALPPKLSVEVVDVSKSLMERNYYPKVTKPYAKLDLLLQRRLKQEEIENKQRQALQQQINWKIKTQNSPDKNSPDKNSESSTMTTTETKSKEPDEDIPITEEEDSPHICYSYMCRQKGKEFCYSPMCLRVQSMDESDLMEMEDVDCEEEDDKNKSIATASTEDEDVEVDIEGDKEAGTVSSYSSKDQGSKSVNSSSRVSSETNTDGASTDEQNATASDGTNTNTNSSSIADRLSIIQPALPSTSPSSSSLSKSPTSASSSTSALSNALSSLKSPAGRAAAVAQLLANRPGLKAITQAQLVLKQAIEKMSVEELRSKMPPIRSTKHGIKLVKYAKFGQKALSWYTC